MRWYEHFFEGPAMAFWASAVSPEWTSAEVGFLLDVLGLEPGMTALDVPCGFGRHALALASRGMRIKGFDIAEACVDGVNAAAREKKLPVEAVRADLAKAELGGGPYDGAYCLGNSFGYFAHEDTVAFCRRVAAGLRTGSRFAVHTAMAAESLLPDFREREWMTAGGITLLLANTYVPERSTLETHYTFIQRDRIEKRASEHHVYTVAEIRRMLEGAGLRVIGQYGGPDRSPFQLRDAELYLVAEKR